MPEIAGLARAADDFGELPETDAAWKAEPVVPRNF